MKILETVRPQGRLYGSTNSEIPLVSRKNDLISLSTFSNGAGRHTVPKTRGVMSQNVLGINLHSLYCEVSTQKVGNLEM